MAIKAESFGIKKLKAAYTGTPAAWNAAIDVYIEQLTADKAAAEALKVLDAKANVMAIAAKNGAESDALAYAQSFGAARTQLAAGTSDPSISNVLASFTSAYGDLYGKHVIYTNYASRSSYNLGKLTDDITNYQASIDTLNSLKFPD